MNADRLLALYDRVADAPGAVSRLRRFVLDLAVRGQLVEQDLEDELELVLLERNQSVRTSDGPFPLPRSWRWFAVGEVGDTRLGKMLDKAKNKGIARPYLRNINVRWFDFDLSDLKEMPFEDSELDEFSLKYGDVLICEGGEPGRAGVWDGRANGVYFQKAVHRVRFAESVDPNFFLICLKASAEDGRLAEYFTGTGIKHFTGKGLRSYCFPLPPLAEQRRIVARVAELTALLDRLETARAVREATRDQLAAASLARLTAPDTAAEDVPVHARFALDALPALATRADQIKSLRQTIRNLAVRGKLVEPATTDEPASELLKRIVEERTQLIQSGEIGKQSPTLPVKQDEVAFSVPSGWVWSRLGSVVMKSDAGWSPRTESHARDGDEWGVLKVSAVSWDHFDLNANKQVLPGTKPRLQAQVHEGDFLISRANTSELVARAVLVLEEPRNLMMSDKIVRLQLSTDCAPRFIWLVNNYSDYGRGYYAANATGVSPSMKNVSRAVILSLPIPLPPLAEQHRIVAKVDTLMALCDQLETALRKADATRARLLDALIHEALSPAALDAHEAAA